MNTNKLARHYPALSPAERLSLMLAAAARGDDLEHGRLAASAPRVTCEVPHTFGRELAFVVAGSHSRMTRLDLAALYFKASADARDRAHLDRALTRAEKRTASAVRELARVRRLQAPKILA